MGILVPLCEGVSEQVGSSKARVPLWLLENPLVLELEWLVLSLVLDPDFVLLVNSVVKIGFPSWGWAHFGALVLSIGVFAQLGG